MTPKLADLIRIHPVVWLGEKIVTCDTLRRGNIGNPVYTLNVYAIWPKDGWSANYVPQSGPRYHGTIALTLDERATLRQHARLSYSQRQEALHRWATTTPNARLVDPLELLGMIHETP